jgi:oxepin-CoA hydrolase/3-oxo-5,6-dehydrosuberyl-CoA semialdehyde dehydrogenase
MYGHHVHEAILKNKEKESGITIHIVDEIYDHGKILFQATCHVAENETPKSLAGKIQILEHRHYWQIIDKFVTDMHSQKLEFISKIFPDGLAQLQPHQTGAWGNMNAWQMVEHITEVFKVSAGLVVYPLETPVEYLPKYKEFLWSEKPFKENTKAPLSVVGEAPPPVKEPSFPHAIAALKEAIAAFETHFKNNPTTTTLHPSFGELNFEEWVQIHDKHLTHHAKQFGLC